MIDMIDIIIQAAIEAQGEIDVHKQPLFILNKNHSVDTTN